MLFRTFLIVFLGLSLGLNADEMNPTIALKKLMDGNNRYKHEKLLHPHQTKEARIASATGQTPFATILGCSDSRVAPELIFDQGIGDLFVVRVAGNVVAPVELDSIEYSVIYLKSSIILVLGHENCGAIQAVIQGQTQDIEAVASLITPSLELARTQEGSLLENTIKDNVLHVVDELKKSPVLSKMIEEKKINVVGGYYNFYSGAVKLITN
ncbi:MAG: carbonic anhydrase [Rhabdochlamydiaceae bacterium]|nr:carbonic anhydrase [Rhabdochlamydiaceae bacterium]